MEENNGEKTQQVVALAFTYRLYLKDNVSQKDVGLFIRPLDIDTRDTGFFRFFYERHKVSAEKPFQFLRGFIEPKDGFFANEIKNVIDKGWAKSGVEAKAILSSLRHLKENTGIDYNFFENAFPANIKLMYIRASELHYDNDTKKNIWVHYCHLHISGVTKKEEKKLIDAIMPGEQTSVVALMPLEKIRKYTALVNGEHFFHINVDDCHHIKKTDDDSKLPKIKVFYEDRAENLIDYNVAGRLINICSNNANILFDELLGETTQPDDYIFPKKGSFKRSEFKFVKELGKGSHASQIEKHVPTGKLFILKFVEHNSKMANNIKENVRMSEKRLKKKLAYNEIMDDMAYCEVLASELYRLHGLNVPKLRLVETVAGKVVASEIIDNFKEDNRRLEKNPPDEVFKGYGCDLAFANYDSLGNVYNLVVTYSSDYNIGFCNVGKNDEKVMRIDLGGSLRYRAQGTFKLKKNFDESEKINLGFIFGGFKLNPGFRNVILNNLSESNYEEKIQLAIDTLTKATNDERTLCVFEYFYGTLEEKQEFADIINNRVKNTISALTELKEEFIIRMKQGCVIL